MSEWELTNITARLVLPPGVLILLGLLGLALVRSRVNFGASLALFAFLSLYLLSTPIVARLLIQSLETPYADPAQERGAGAIVVLPGGLRPRAPEYGGDTASHFSLERARYAAHLHRRAGLHVIAAPTGFKTDLGVRPLDFFPVAPALNDSYDFFHELLGIAWYRLKFALAH